MTNRSHKPSRSKIRRHEELETRHMLSGHSLGAAFAGHDQFVSTFARSTPAVTPQIGNHLVSAASNTKVAAHNQVVSTSGSPFLSAQTVLTAQLTDPTNSSASGTFTYDTGSLFGVPLRW
jgi:hypothetical protein